MKREVLTEEKAEALLSKHVPIAKNAFTRSLHDAVVFSKNAKFPLVLKLISPKALHKSDVGGVIIVRSHDELVDKYEALVSLAARKKLPLKGILVQEYIEGRQFVIGIQNDATFGHVLMVGLGGIFVEILKDVVFRVCPITHDDADDMLNELKNKAILEGVRGEKAVNKKVLKNVLVECSKLPEKYHIQELDINPFILNHRVGKVVDARIVLQPS